MPTLDQLEDMAGKILRNAICRAVAGERALTMTEIEQAACLEPFQGHVDVSTKMLRECLEQASAEGANAVHRSLHTQPGVDPFMLDEAVEHAGSGEDG